MTVGAEKSIALGVSQVLGNTLDMCGTFLHYANRATLEVGYLYGALQSTLGRGYVRDILLENKWALEAKTLPETYYGIERDITRTFASKTSDWCPDESTLSDNENSNNNNNKQTKITQEKRKEKDIKEQNDQKDQIYQNIELPSKIDYTALPQAQWLSLNNNIAFLAEQTRGRALIARVSGSSPRTRDHISALKHTYIYAYI